MKNRFFTSDTHFGSNNILFREDRPFKDMDEFEKFEIDTWNSQTEEGDVIYFLGDFVEYASNKPNWDECFGILKKLKAKVILIIGNNERRIIEEYFDGDFENFRKHCIQKGFLDVKQDDLVSIDDRKVYLVHEPTRHREGMLNLFGHTHRSTGLWKPYGINVDCDLNHFRLYSEADIIKLFNCKEKYWDHDPDNLCMGSTENNATGNASNGVIKIEDFNKLDIRVGTIIAAEKFAGAKKPAYKLRIDFGKDIRTKNSSAQLTELYREEDLIGKQILAIVNFPPKQIADFMSEVLVLGLYDRKGIILISPDNHAENGDKLG